MGNLTSGEIAILVVQGAHIITNVYMRYDHLFTSSCCDGKGCMMSNAAITHDLPEEKSKQ